MRQHKKYPLPAHLQEAFVRLAQQKPLAGEAVTKACDQLYTALQKMGRLGAQDFIGPNLELAKTLTQRAHYLLDNYSDFNAQQQSLISAAIHYFILQKDSVPDTTPIIGYDDDVAVMNHVLEEIAQEQLFIEV